jgi:hypothetical protein
MLTLFIGFLIGAAVMWLARRAALQDARQEWEKERASLPGRVQYLEAPFLETEGIWRDGTLGPTKEDLLARIEDLQDHLASMAGFISNQNARLEEAKRELEMLRKLNRERLTEIR